MTEIIAAIITAVGAIAAACITGIFTVLKYRKDSASSKERSRGGDINIKDSQVKSISQDNSVRISTTHKISVDNSRLIVPSEQGEAKDDSWVIWVAAIGLVILSSMLVRFPVQMRLSLVVLIVVLAAASAMFYTLCTRYRFRTRSLSLSISLPITSLAASITYLIRFGQFSMDGITLEDIYSDERLVAQSADSEGFIENVLNFLVDPVVLLVKSYGGEGLMVALVGVLEFVTAVLCLALAYIQILQAFAALRLSLPKSGGMAQKLGSIYLAETGKDIAGKITVQLIIAAIAGGAFELLFLVV